VEDKKLALYQTAYLAGIHGLLNKLNVSSQGHNTGIIDFCGKYIMSDESEFMDLNAQCEEDIHVSNSCSLP
jgi:hypothetical protein